jgi:hypothetical protein
MATDGPTPQPCNDKIFKKGTSVFVTHTIPSNAMAGWVKKVAEKSGQPVDWHFCGGRANVLALGNLKKVHEAIRELMPEHDELMKKEIMSLGLRTNDRR